MNGMKRIEPVGGSFKNDLEPSSVGVKWPIGTGISGAMPCCCLSSSVSPKQFFSPFHSPLVPTPDFNPSLLLCFCFSNRKRELGHQRDAPACLWQGYKPFPIAALGTWWVWMGMKAVEVTAQVKALAVAFPEVCIAPTSCCHKILSCLSCNCLLTSLLTSCCHANATAHLEPSWANKLLLFLIPFYRLLLSL